MHWGNMQILATTRSLDRKPFRILSVMRSRGTIQWHTVAFHSKKGHLIPPN